MIAGSFKLETGAQTRLSELLKLGYNKAEIIRFKGSDFYSVSADRFDSKQKANDVRRKLEQSGKIEAFVKAVQ